MKIIKILSDMIEDEIDGALDYARKACEWKGEHKKLAATMWDLAQEELTHITRLHDDVVRIIEEYRQEKGEPPADMLAVYEYLHKRHIDEVADVRRYLDMYKTM